MAKGYWIAHVDPKDADSYKPYVAASSSVIASFGGKFLVRGGGAEVVEGVSRSRHVVVEFPDFNAALSCYQSDEYQLARRMRIENSIGGEVIVVEGTGL